ncbi:MAG: excisionase family DNA-binding protein [Candidatus Limnocylindrales bacterium]
MDPLLSPEQAADALGVRRTMIFAMLASGECAWIKLGKLRRIPASAVDRHVAGRPGEPDGGRSA